LGIFDVLPCVLCAFLLSLKLHKLNNLINSFARMSALVGATGNVGSQLIDIASGVCEGVVIPRLLETLFLLRLLDLLRLVKLRDLIDGLAGMNASAGAAQNVRSKLVDIASGICKGVVVLRLLETLFLLRLLNLIDLLDAS
jgi:hypothetical protein